MPTESPVARSTIGLKTVVFAPLAIDNDKIAAYGELQRLHGAIEANINPGNNEPDIQYADDCEYSLLTPDPEITVTIKLADIPLALQSAFLGGQIDDNGVLIKSAGRKPYYFAIGFKALKSNGKYRYTWLYKCRARAINENYGTKEGKTITRREPEIELTALKLRYDKRYQAVADEDVPTYTQGPAFLSSVYGYPGDYSLLIDLNPCAVTESGTELILTSDPTATFDLSDSATALVITTTTNT